MGQSGSVPLHTTAPPQAGLPGSFAGAGVQAPPVPWRLQRSQLPEQALLQQLPSAQKPDWHCELAVHATPWARRASQRPLSQKRPATQLRVELHEVGHAPLTPSQAYAPHWVTAVASASGVHRPQVPTALQVSHAPPHAALQHTPPTQKPDEQSPGRLQESPFAARG
jgi:hypothetical protein